MTYFNCTLPFTTKNKKWHLPIDLVASDGFNTWLKNQDESLQNKCESMGFEAQKGRIVVLHDTKGNPERIIAGMPSDAKGYEYAELAATLSKTFSEKLLKNTSFGFVKIAKSSSDDAALGWGLNAYRFDQYKSGAPYTPPVLVWPKECDKKSIQAYLNAIFALRNLVNAPSNILGPAEIENAVKDMAKTFEAKVNVIKDKALLEKNFPLVYTVGQASPRRPRLIELSWGKTSHPKVTLVGKGVVFDTGGLDIKPSGPMRFMKKDMGGAAHTMALAYLIMAHKLPVRLHLVIPAVENAIAGDAFRPGDIIKSRKGLFVENTNTDAEGRLILADALTYACEKEPELVIDYATLTGSARAGLGPDIPAFFCTDDKAAQTLQNLSPQEEDPVWNMPLWSPYKRFIEASEGDLVNSAGVPGDLIYSALFLQSFLTESKSGKSPTWMHFDCYAWEQSGKAGRPRGGADTGLRAAFKYLQGRYA